MSNTRHSGFLAWNPHPGNRAPSHQHMSLADAQREAEILARTNPGNRFYVMAPVGVAEGVLPKPPEATVTFSTVAPAIKVDPCDLDDADIPF